MVQFDVHRNPGRQGKLIPFVVVVQSAAFDDSPRRVVAPLVDGQAFGLVHSARFNPGFSVLGEQVVMQPLELVSVPKAVLGPPLASLKDEAQRIVDALDELCSRAYG